MKIAFAMINCNRRDGSARAVCEVAERLVARGHDLHLFARKVEDMNLSGITWHKVPGPSWPEVADFSSYHHSVNRLISSADFDIVHSIGPNTLKANVVTIQNIQPAKIPVLRRHSAGENISPFRRLTRSLYLRATSAAEKALYTRPKPPLFLPVSRGVAEELRQHYHIGEAALRIIPNAADTDIFRPLAAEARQAWRADNGFGDNDLIAIFSGGEWSRKGLDLAIRGLALCSHQSLQLLVAGDDPDRERFHALAGHCGVRDRVHFAGFRQDIASAMAASDLFLFPSHYEAFSLASLEAASCGLPIIASKINGTEDFISPGRNGEFIPHDPEGIAACLDGLLNDPAKVQAMGKEARQLVLSQYTWDRITSLTEDAYQSLPS